MEKNDFITNKNIVILLTACVNPGNVAFLERRNPRVRLNDYLWALKLWLTDSDNTPIIFCENSNQELSEIAEIVQKYNQHQKSIELLSFHGQNYPGILGKGYGEMGIISYALNNSNIINKKTLVLKVTGRLYLENAAHVIKEILKRKDIDVFCDLRRNLTTTDSRVFCGSATFLKDFLIPKQEIIDDSKGISFEAVLARAVHLAIAHGKKWALLPSAPNLHGVFATLNKPYKASFPLWLCRESYRFIKEAVLSR